MASTEINTRDLDRVLDDVYAWSRRQDYRGYNKHDGLNSPLLRAALGWSKWPRMVAIQGVMRFPINIRPLLLVPKTYNPKGLGLFTVGLLDRYDTHKDPAHLEEAKKILSLLMTLRSPGKWSGDCWGYQYPWQDPGFYAPVATPNAVVTCFVLEAFLHAYRTTHDAQYLDTVGRSVRFLQRDLTILKDTTDELCLSYMPLPMTMRVMDVSILIGSVLAQYARLSGENAVLKPARRLLNYVMQRQTDYGAWYYTDPPDASLIRHDNYHTGFILDALWRYMDSSNDRQWQERYDKGLDFYARQLFNDDGSPRWMSDCDYPHDIHGAAQGIITFSRHPREYPGKAQSIARWALESMYHPSGRFYYQNTRFYKKRFTLLRWCNAWMARALAQLVADMKSNKPI
jgi:hypothetical protein